MGDGDSRQLTVDQLTAAGKILFYLFIYYLKLILFAVALSQVHPQSCLPHSVADPDPNPDPDPPDPHVFGPHGSGSTSQRYGSGSGSRSGS